jgi:hypothetical protein
MGDVMTAAALRNAHTPEDKRITFRVGINLWDVIAEPDDIYGDGVNVAARSSAQEPKVCRLTAGGRRIRTSGSASDAKNGLRR